MLLSTPIKTILFLLFLIELLPGCSPKNTVDPNALPPPVEGEWTASMSGGGFNNFESFRNYQYSFDVATANQVVDVVLISPDINVQYALFDPLGQRIDASTQGRSSSKPYTLNAGKYRIVVAADRGAIGNFNLSVLTTKDGLVRLPFQTLSSAKQNWGPMGGGGNVKTFKNHFYTFDATEDNFSVDIELISADTDVSLYLYDALGQQIDIQNASNARSQYVLTSLKKGTYTIMAATATRGGVGNYQLTIVGKVQNLGRVESQTTTVTGRWPDNKSTDTYSLQITPNSSPLDLEVASPDTPAYLQVQTITGSYVGSTGNGVSKSLVLVQQGVPKNTYQIQVFPVRIGTSGPGSYTLTVNGQFSDLKKI